MKAYTTTFDLEKLCQAYISKGLSLQDLCNDTGFDYSTLKKKRRGEITSDLSATQLANCCATLATPMEMFMKKEWIK